MTNQENEGYHQAAANWESKDDTRALKGCEKLASSPNYGRTTQGRQDNAAITAR